MPFCRYRNQIASLRAAVLAVLSVVLLVPAQSAAAGPPENLPRVIPSQYIVVFKDNVNTDAAANEFAGRFNMSVLFRYRHALRGMAIKMSPALLDRLSADPRVAYIEQDVVVFANAQTLPTGIDRINADLDPVASIDNSDDRVNVDIAILDTGIDLDHSDLNLYRYAYCKDTSPRHPVDYGCVENDPGAEDGNSHGTHVAGIAAAIDNTSGVVGVAPGARIWAIKVLEDNGSGEGSQVLAGVDYVTANASEIEVANMSLTGSGAFQPLDDAISEAVAAGVTIVLAAGNSQTDVSQVFPAGHPSAITVSALSDFDGEPGGIGSLSLNFGSCIENLDDSFACFSNFGSAVDIMAPGVQIRSTVPGGGSAYKSGTSMAAPHVAGAAALYLSQNMGASPATVKAALLAAGDTVPCVNGSCSDDPDGIQEPLLMQGCTDTDSDGVCDVDDNCPAIANAAQTDTDEDLSGDVCDTDDDDDALSDSEEGTQGTNPLVADTDGDGLSDGEEVNTYKTDPLLTDSDDDLLDDYDEVITYGTDPLTNDRADLAPRGATDGIVDVADYLVLTRLVTGAITATGSEVVFGDLNKNGGLDAGDLVLMMRVVSGEIALP